VTVVGSLVAATGVSSGAVGPRPPTFGRSVDIGLVKGIVLVMPRHGESFQLGVVDRNIPVGSLIDTTRGEVDLRTAYAPRSGHPGVQDGQFTGGQFMIRQRRDQKGLSVLDLVLPRDAGDRCALGADASNTKNRRRVLALLRATAHGAFRTRGRYSAATVRGTRWNVLDRCDGTLTSVVRGVVTVRDFVRHVTVTVRAGQKYLARAP
jgi:hypothetical protein